MVTREHGHDLMPPAALDWAHETLSPERARELVHDVMGRYGLACWCTDDKGAPPPGADTEREGEEGTLTDPAVMDAE